jgi:hypothetical protein
VEEIWEQHVRSFVKIYDMLHLGEDRSREDVSKTNRYVEIDERQSYANAGI